MKVKAGFLIRASEVMGSPAGHHTLCEFSFIHPRRGVQLALEGTVQLFYVRETKEFKLVFRNREHTEFEIAPRHQFSYIS